MESTDPFCTAAGELAAAATPRKALYARLEPLLAEHTVVAPEEAEVAAGPR